MKIIAIFVLAAGLIPLVGCSDHFFPLAHDIETVGLMQTMGVDLGERDQVSVTFSSGLIRQGDSGEVKAPLVLSNEGETLFDACLKIQSKSDYYVFLGHTGQCLVGEEAAQQGITDLTDFLERDTEMRLNTNLFIVKEGTAAQAIEACTSEEHSVFDRLSSMEKDMSLDSTTYVDTVKNLLVQLEESGCGVAAAVRIEEDTLSSDGYACFQDNALIGYLDKECSRGVNLLQNQVSGGNVNVQLAGGTVAALRLEDTNCKWKAEFDGSQLKRVTVQVEVGAGLEEVRGDVDLLGGNAQQELERGLEEEVKKEIETVLKQVQEWNADVLHIRQQVAMSCPAKKAWLEKSWDSWYPQGEINVEVSAAVTRSYDINQPLERKGDK